MHKQLPFFNLSLKKVLALEPDSFKRAKIKIAFTLLIFTIIKAAIVVPAALQHHQTLQLLRIACIFLIFVVCIKLLLYRPHYIEQISHFIIISGLGVIFSNLLIYAQQINVISIQVVFTLSLISYYLIGGFFAGLYTFIAITPIVFFLLTHDTSHLNLGAVPAELPSPAFETIVILNFITFVIIHYMYYQSFYENLREKEVLNKQLEDNIEEVKALADSRSLFLSTMSHELRTPLNGIIGMANLLKDNATGEQKENLDILEFSANNLQVLINDILDYNKIEMNKIELENISVNLAALLKRISSGLEIKASEKSLRWELELDEALGVDLVKTDPTRITQIIYNLAGNAIKFTEKGFVKVKAAIIDKSNEYIKVKISISDTGIGIDPKRHQAIFDPFVQASTDTTRHYGGTGLGLAIVKKLLALFDSHIVLESIPGRGSTFSFVINFALQLSSNNFKVKSEAPFDTIRGMKLLIVEDNQINILLLQRLMLRWGVESEITLNGQDAIYKLLNERFDLVLMDLHMPVMDGYQATKAIRMLGDPEKSQIPIIALTASVSHTVYAKIREAGMQDYLAKPFQPEQLYTKLQKFYTPPLELGDETVLAI